MMSAFVDKLMLKAQHINWLAKHSGNEAWRKDKTECQRCGYCCAVRPCIPTPIEFKAIAKFLDMTEKEMFNAFFVIDQLADDSQQFIFPAKTTQLDLIGRFVPWRRTYDDGYCVFYLEDEKRCRIHSVLPYYAMSFCCWIEDENDTSTDDAIKTWKDFDWKRLGIVK